VVGYPQLAHSGAMEGIVAVTHIAGKPTKDDQARANSPMQHTAIRKSAASV